MAASGQYFVNVFYDGPEANDLDLDYYVNVHMPKVYSLLKEKGMISWHIIDMRHESANVDHRIQTIAFWTSKEAYDHAWDSEEALNLFAGVDRYSKVVPTGASGYVVGSSK